MRRVWIFTALLLVCLTAVLIGNTVLKSRPHVPPPLEAKSCESGAPVGELARERFVRTGGRTTRYVNVWRDGDSFVADGIAQGRNLGLYERLDLADPEPRTVGDPGGDSVLAQARKFLWLNWHDRRRAYLTITLSSVDAMSTAHVFIEPDETGRWRVYWRSVRSKGVIDDSPTAYSMEWIIPRGYDEPGTPIGVGQMPDPVRDQLQFRDVCGEVDGRF